VFAVMGMHPVGYYDLSTAGVPVHATAFRPVGAEALSRNPFRVFTSLLRIDLIGDEVLRTEAEAILAARRIFTDSAIQLEVFAGENLVLREEIDDTSQSDLERGASNWYVMDSLVPFTRGEVQAGGRIVLSILGDDAWKPQMLFVFGLDTASGFAAGDTYLLPFVLGWHLAQADFMTSAGLYAPTGRFAQGGTNNTGLDGLGDNLTVGLNANGRLIDLANGGPDTLTLTTVAGSYSLNLARVENLVGSGGNDSVTLQNAVSGMAVNLNGGTDSLNLSNGNNNVTVSGTESIHGGSGFDTVTLGDATPVTINSVESVIGAGGNDRPIGAGGGSHRRAHFHATQKCAVGVECQTKGAVSEGRQIGGHVARQTQL